MRKLLLLLAIVWLPATFADLKLPGIFGNHMVLQRGQANLIWGWDTPGTRVTVSFSGQRQTSVASADGRWSAEFKAQPANAVPQTIIIVGTTKREILDVLVGEVWLCSGQSNMDLKLDYDSNGDLEAAASNLPNLRLLVVPQVGPPDLQTDFEGEWRPSTPATARRFSAVGFLFGRYIHEVLCVPVGIIDNAWGGSTTEAWIRREDLEKNPNFQELIVAAKKKDADLLSPNVKAEYERAVAEWKLKAEKAVAEGRPVPGGPPNWQAGGTRPGNLFAGILNPIIGYGLKGVVWYQGESNTNRAYEHGYLFPFLIEQWRKEWRQGDFSFYWVQLPRFSAAKSMPSDSEWAELRETQTRALRLPNTGQAVCIDLGEAQNIHPRNKHEVAVRLARWALAKDYGLKIPYRSPEFRTLEIAGNKATIVFDCFGSSLKTFDVGEVQGFSICGSDKAWHWAKATITAPNKVEVKSDEVSIPVAVRYAWADNPNCNLYSEDCLPVTPFRTDEFDMITQPSYTKVR